MAKTDPAGASDEPPAEHPPPPVFQIFGLFFRIGAVTFGGGYAMVPLFEHEMSRKRQWLPEEELVDVLAVCQSMPGVIAANAANLIGYRLRGRRGALAGVLGVSLPSFLIILLAAAFLAPYRENPAVIKAFLGIRCAVAALMLRAFWQFFRRSVKDGFTGLILITVFALAVWGFNPFFLAGAGLLLGLAAYRFFPRPEDRL